MKYLKNTDHEKVLSLSELVTVQPGQIVSNYGNRAGYCVPSARRKYESQSELTSVFFYCSLIQIVSLTVHNYDNWKIFNF